MPLTINRAIHACSHMFQVKTIYLELSYVYLGTPPELSNETVHNPDSLPSKSLPKPAGKSRGGDVINSDEFPLFSKDNSDNNSTHSY